MKSGKIIIIIAAIFLIFMTGCSKGEDDKFSGPTKEELKNMNKSGFPIVKDKIKLNIFARHDPASNDN